MHSRAEQRGFDWEKSGHFRIKDNPHIFLEPTDAEQKARMPPPQDVSATVLIGENAKELDHSDAEAIAAAAAVVDASVDSGLQPTEEQTAAAAAVAATMVADPTAGIVDHASV